MFAGGLVLVVAQVVQPAEYRSPAGTFGLFVDPSDRRGRGPAHCVMTRDGATVWERELALTFLDALVNDDGSAVGYGYPEGVGQMEGELVVARLAADGSPQSEERETRVASAVIHGCPDPTVLQLVRTEGGFALQVAGNSGRSWWLYDEAKAARKSEQQKAPAFVADARAPRTTWSVPDVELISRGRVQFPWPVPNEVAKDDPGYDEYFQRRAHRVFVDAQSRVWISELSTRIVHVFDSGGTPLFERPPDPKHFRPYRPPDWITVRDDGSLFVQSHDAVEQTGPSGERVGRSPIEKYSFVRWLFLPGGERRWSVDPGGIDLQDSEGRTLRHVERSANRRWLDGLWTMAMAEDGALAVLADPTGSPDSSEPRDPSYWLHTFAPNGNAARSVQLPDEVRPLEIAFQRGRIALASGADLWMLTAECVPISHSTLPKEVAGDGLHLFFSPTGDELWVFPHSRAEMYRFEVKR